MANTNKNLEAYWPYKHRRSGHNPQWYQSKSWKPPRKISQQEFVQRQIRREKEERLRKCVRQITRSCKGMLRRKLEEIEAFNSSLHQDKLEKNKCFYCREKGHLIRTCPKKIMDDAASSHKYSIANIEKEKENNNAEPEVTLKYPEFIHFNTNGILKGTDQGSRDDLWLESKSGYKEQRGSWLESLGLSRVMEKDVRKCFRVYLDVCTSYTRQQNALDVPAKEQMMTQALSLTHWTFGKTSAPHLPSQKGKDNR
ncbi:ARID DNA-binding domain-containing protein [Tanacetum coccineum]